MINLGNYIIYIILVANVIGLFYYRKLPNAKAKSLLGIIFVSFLTEFLGFFFAKWTGMKSYIVFNTYILVIFNYYMYLLNTLLKKSLNRKISNVFFFFFNSCYIVNIVYLQNLFEEMITYCFAVGVIFVLILSCLYLVEIFNSNKVMHYKKSIYFWTVLGILLFYIPLLPLMVAFKLVIQVNTDLWFRTILFMLNLLMYSSFVTGFVCSQKKYNY